MKSNAQYMGGASAASIYKLLGVHRKSEFNIPESVAESVKSTTDAKFYTYTDSDKVNKNFTVIFVAGPDLNKIELTKRSDAVKKLSTTYGNIFREFQSSGKKTIRLLPISTANFGGKFKKDRADMCKITTEAISGAYKNADASLRTFLDAPGTKLSMCLYKGEHLDLYEKAFLSTVNTVKVEKVKVIKKARKTARTVSLPPKPAPRPKIVAPVHTPTLPSPGPAYARERKDMKKPKSRVINILELPTVNSQQPGPDTVVPEAEREQKVSASSKPGTWKSLLPVGVVAGLLALPSMIHRMLPASEKSTASRVLPWIFGGLTTGAAVLAGNKYLNRAEDTAESDSIQTVVVVCLCIVLLLGSLFMFFMMLSTQEGYTDDCPV